MWTYELKVLLRNRIEGGKLWFLLIYQNAYSKNNNNNKNSINNSRIQL